MVDQNSGGGGTKPATTGTVPLAIALDAAPGSTSMDRPRAARVLATGRGAVAEQILAIAFERGVPVREDADLAQILSTLDVESEIPIDALAAVAEIMSYVYRMNRTWPQGRGDDAPAQGKLETES
jgi:flagellar biosynthesis protein